MKKDKTKKMKSPNAYVIIFAVIVVIAILSWFIPGGSYELDKSGQAIAGTYHTVKSNPQGIWEILMAPITGMIGDKTISGAISVSLFIMMFGAFLEMTDESNALKVAIKGITQRNKGNSHLLILILVTIMAILGTIEGAYEEGFVYLMMITPVLLAMGFDTITALMIVILGTQAGCLGSTINPFAVGIASEIAGISPGDGIVFRLVVLVLMIGIVTVYICRYSDKVKANPELSSQYYRREEDLKLFDIDEGEELKLTKVQRKVLFIFIALFVIMTIALIPWDSLNKNWTFFINVTNKIKSIPYLGTVIGGILPFGQWYFNEISMLLLVMTFIMGKIMKKTTDETINTIIRGASNLVSTALIVAVARGIQVVMNNGYITPTILHFGESTLSALSPKLFIVVSFVFYLLLAIFIPSSSGLAAATMSIMASLATFAHVDKSIMINAFLYALGLAKMFTPTSVIIMTCLQAAHVGYGTWVKNIWKFLVFIFLLCCVFLIIGTVV